MENILLPDTVLENRYKVTALINTGPISRTYEGYDLKHKKNVFIKELIIKYKDRSLRQQAIEQFKSEANILFNLKHKNLPKFQDYFDYQENRYLIIEYIEGKRLNTIAEDHKGFLPEKKIIRWGIELCDVLSYLHKREPNPVVFRDMEPEAILVSKDGILKLIDFGISKIYEGDIKKTRDVAKVMIQHYSPIEQHTGGTDTRSDIYSLGATMYYLITKEPPMDCIDRSFEDEPMKSCREINPNISPELDRIILKAMEMDKKKRYQDIAEMRYELIKLSELFLQKPSDKIEDKEKMEGESFVNFSIKKAVKPFYKIKALNPEQLESEEDSIIADKKEEQLEMKEEASDELSIEEVKLISFEEVASEDVPISVVTEEPYKEEPVEISGEKKEELPVLDESVILRGRYKIIELLKKSTLSRVYKGVDLKRNQIIAIKELFPDKLKASGKKESIDKVHAETRSLLYLDYLNLPVFSDYLSREGKNYLIMEYIEGKSLKSIVENSNALPPWNTVLEWTMQLCNVLHYLHDRKPKPFVFKVLCPENIILEETGIVKLIDFGISKLYNPDVTPLKETKKISHFSSPEECLDQVDIRSDIYSLGITMYYLLTGKIPPHAFDRVIDDVPLYIEKFDKDIPPELIQIILKATKVDKNRRFQEIIIMKECLEVLYS